MYNNIIRMHKILKLSTPPPTHTPHTHMYYIQHNTQFVTHIPAGTFQLQFHCACRHSYGDPALNAVPRHLQQCLAQHQQAA